MKEFDGLIDELNELKDMLKEMSDAKDEIKELKNDRDKFFDEHRNQYVYVNDYTNELSKVVVVELKNGMPPTVAMIIADIIAKTLARLNVDGKLKKKEKEKE